MRGDSVRGVGQLAVQQPASQLLTFVRTHNGLLLVESKSHGPGGDRVVMPSPGLQSAKGVKTVGVTTTIRVNKTHMAGS